MTVYSQDVLKVKMWILIFSYHSIRRKRNIKSQVFAHSRPRNILSYRVVCPGYRVL